MGRADDWSGRLTELGPFWEMRASNEAARKAGSGAHTATRIDNLQFDEGSSEQSRLGLMADGEGPLPNRSSSQGPASAALRFNY